jgi:RNA-directed DNA polymerase
MQDTFSFGNIYRCYLNCRKNKRNTINALKFEISAEENMLKLERELKTKSYHPSRSILFAARKPKLREIFAADFRDRVVHHILVGYLEGIWEKIFIYDSYACRKEKGTHRAVMRLQSFLRKVSKNGRVKAYYLQLDIKDFFTSIDKNILFSIIKKKLKNKDILWLAQKIIFWDCTKSFILRDKEVVIKRVPSNKSLFDKDNKRGLPIGNLTSQFFANVYLNELDQFTKHALKAKYYIRYVDDFILLNNRKEELISWMDKIEEFLQDRLNIKLHPKRRRLQAVSNGVDFLGYIVRQNYILVRRRVINNMKERLRCFEKLLVSCCNHKKPNLTDILKNLRSSIQSYLGHMGWANSLNLLKKLAGENIVSTYFKIDGYRLAPKFLNSMNQ